jgi:hypothetical protein
MFKLKGMMFLALVIMLMAYGCTKPGATGPLVFKNVRVFDGERTHVQITVVVENSRNDKWVPISASQRELTSSKAKDKPCSPA